MANFSTQFTFGSSASTPAMTTDSSSYTSPLVFSVSNPAIENDRGFIIKKKKSYIKQGCRSGSHLQGNNNAPVSLQAPASQFEFKLPAFNFSSSVAFSTTPSMGSFANVETKPASNSSALEQFSSERKSDPEKENMSATGPFLADNVKQNKATRKSNQVPVSNSPLPLTMVSRILNGIPQHPHFYQFRNCSELTRKNLIAAWDRSFEETEKEIHSLQDVDHFWVRAKELWKTMEELQNVGYNVIPLRKRLVELTDVTMEFESRKAEIKGLKVKAENHRLEKCRLESVILNLQAMAKREEDRMESLLIEAANLEDDLPKFCGVFAKLAMEPLAPL